MDRVRKVRRNVQMRQIARALLIAQFALPSAFAGCGAQYAQMADESPPAPQPENGGYAVQEDSAQVQTVSDGRPRAPAPAPMAAGASHRESAKKSGSYSNSNAYEQQAYKGPSQNAQQPQAAKADPMVVYFGYLRLRVKRQIEAIDAVTKVAQQSGGYVQSQSGHTVIVRVPAADFDAVMAKFSAVGEVIDRRVKALDVTRQFTDLDARLAVAVEARTRLLALLKTVQNVEERLLILEEIKRLSEQIETAESTLATLRNLANYYTITLDLEPVVAQVAASTHVSPFQWVRSLQPHLVSLTAGKKDATMDMPKGFVLFEDDDVFRAQAADTAMLRVGRTQNEPRGDSAFWSDAVHFEFDGRDEELVDQGTYGNLRARVYRNKDQRPRYYLVGVQSIEDKLYVVEVFFPNETAWNDHIDDVRKALATFKLK